MHITKKILASILSVALSLTAFWGCGATNTEANEPPNYSDSKKSFDFWAYHSTYNGWYNGELEDKTGISKENKTTLKAFKDAGFNILFISYAYALNGKDFKNSEAKQVMDIAYELGLKCMVFEQITHTLSLKGDSLITGDKSTADGVNTFATQEDLNAYVKDVIKDIVEHPAFYGFSLRDEPSHMQITSIGQVYTAIQSVKKCFVNMNLLPMPLKGSNIYAENGKTKTGAQCYEEYLNTYKTKTGASWVQYDDYPLKPNFVRAAHIVNAKITAEFCKKNNMRFCKAFQTCSYSVAGKEECRKPLKEDMYWQLNIGMAFGVKTYSYWTYYPVVNPGGEKYDITACFVTPKGEKNEMYYWMKDIHAEMQNTARALACFDYRGMNLIKTDNIMCNTAYLEQDFGEYDFEKIEKYEIKSGTGAVLITELYDEGRENYGYYVTNVTDPTLDSKMKVSLKFYDCDNALIFNKGAETNVKANKQTLELELKKGEGVFVIPY